MPRKPGPTPLPHYEPSDRALEALRAWQEAVAEEERLRHAARAALAADLKSDPDLPYASVAKHDRVPWTEMTLRGIGKEYGVQPRQPNKAKSTAD
ncbi:hypothetical protein [Streptomyces sp. NBC_00425]|uniref:hypothetical protein n=1 Tax=Streptomyces sp. NBC_00425 TaxID=2975740 RepID=UPI002E2400E4